MGAVLARKALRFACAFVAIMFLMLVSVANCGHAEAMAAQPQSASDATEAKATSPAEKTRKAAASSAERARETAVSPAEKSRKTAASTAIKLNRSKANVTSGESFRLLATVLPACVDSKKITWQSSNRAVADVDGGKVTGYKFGRAVITAKAPNGTAATCIVTVNAARAGDFDTFAIESVKLMKTADARRMRDAGAEPVGELRLQSEDGFSFARLIVKDDGADIDFSSLKAVAVVRGGDGISIVQFRTGAHARRALSALSQSPHVEWAEPDCSVEIMEPQATTAQVDSQAGALAGARADALTSTRASAPDEPQSTSSAYTQADPLISTQASSRAFMSWGVKAIGADKLAKSLRSLSRSVTVAVIDSGVSKHKVLRNRIAEGGYDFVSGDSNPSDQRSHGTHVAGTIVDCTPGLKVKILPERVIDANGRGSASRLALGIMHATTRKASVINLSVGSTKHSRYIDAAVNYAVKNGVTVCVASGNSDTSTSNFCPAHMAKPIVVGAVGRDLRRAYFSNYGRSLDVVAPGVGIRSCALNGRYAVRTGTSMATPHISAAAAMIKLKHPRYKPAQVWRKLKKCTRDLGARGRDNSYGYGLPNLGAVK